MFIFGADCFTASRLNLYRRSYENKGSRDSERIGNVYRPGEKGVFAQFFQNRKGQYGEGDKFLGIVVPNTRLVAKRHKEEPFEAIADLLESEWHECRLCALLMLVERFKKSGEKARKEIYDFYLTQTAHINNWDLVDLSAPYIVGEYLKGNPVRICTVWLTAHFFGSSVLQ